MSFRLKAASLVAVVISAVATLAATDPSLASGTADTAGTLSIATRALSSADDLPALQDEAHRSGGPVSIVHNPDGSVTVTPRIVGESDSDDDSADSTPTSSLAALVDAQVVPAELDDQMQCLAGAVYYEAKGETLPGQLAVARVVINRSQSPDFPHSFCGVVTQAGQFSFVRHGQIPAVNTASPAWRRAVAISMIALDNLWTNKAKGALYFHARRVAPGWNRTKLVAIDNHVFYR